MGARFVPVATHMTDVPVSAQAGFERTLAVDVNERPPSARALLGNYNVLRPNVTPVGPSPLNQSATFASSDGCPRKI